jgi:hypothetical protein
VRKLVVLAFTLPLLASVGSASPGVVGSRTLAVPNLPGVVIGVIPWTDDLAFDHLPPSVEIARHHS